MRAAMGTILIAVLLTVATGATMGASYPPSPTPAPAPPPAQPSALSVARAEAKVAAQHAQFAAEGQTLSYVTQHLRHVLMCIEGPKGKNVAPAWENPCKGLGSGVLVDLQRAQANPALLNMARTADSDAVAGYKSANLARMKAVARQVAALMTQVAK